MAKVKSEIKDKSFIEKIKLGEKRVEALKGNTEVVLDETVITAYGNSVRKLREANNKVASAEIKLNEMYKSREEADNEYSRQTEVIMNKINSTTTIETKLAGTGFPINRTGISERNTALEIPSNVRVTNTNIENQLQVRWNHVNTAHGYIVQYGADSQFGDKNVTELHIGTISKILIDDLATGTKIWVRIKAIRSDIKGPWSDPAMCIVK